jgi:hypothetical protein
LNFYTDLSEDARIPTAFGEFIGGLDYEIARIIVVFMGDVFRFSLAAGGSQCPFCPVQLHAQHLFLCPNCPFRGDLPIWSTIIEAFHVSDWALFVRLILTGFYVWQSNTSFFRSNCKDRVSLFLGHDLGRGPVN